jgi:hypothetical protein
MARALVCSRDFFVFPKSFCNKKKFASPKIEINICETANGGCRENCTFLGNGLRRCGCFDSNAIVSLQDGVSCTCRTGYRRVEANKTCQGIFFCFIFQIVSGLCFGVFYHFFPVCSEFFLIFSSEINPCDFNNGGCEDHCIYQGPGRSICDCKGIPNSDLSLDEKTCPCNPGFEKSPVDKKTCPGV